jgi:hypothetical protein
MVLGVGVLEGILLLEIGVEDVILVLEDTTGW